METKPYSESLRAISSLSFQNVQDVLVKNGVELLLIDERMLRLTLAKNIESGNIKL